MDPMGIGFWCQVSFWEGSCRFIINNRQLLPGGAWWAACRLWGAGGEEGKVCKLLLMEENPNNHLTCMKPCKSWDNLPYQLVIARFLPSTVGEDLWTIFVKIRSTTQRLSRLSRRQVFKFCRVDRKDCRFEGGSKMICAKVSCNWIEDQY